MWFFKNLHDCRCEGNWTIVIQARGFTVLRYRDYDRFCMTDYVIKHNLHMDYDRLKKKTILVFGRIICTEQWRYAIK